MQYYFKTELYVYRPVQVLYSYSHAFCFDIENKMLIFANKWNSLLRMVEIIYEQKLNLIDNVMSQSLFRFEGIFQLQKIFNFMIDIIWTINTINLSQFERHCNLFCFYTLYYYYGNLLFMSRYRWLKESHRIFWKKKLWIIVLPNFTNWLRQKQ